MPIAKKVLEESGGGGSRPPLAPPLDMDIGTAESNSCSKDCTEDEICFYCKICWQLAEEPIVTQCGHLNCWLCLYSWLQYLGVCMGWVEGIFRPNPPWWVKKKFNPTQPTT